jgi:hypothetical protein
MLRRYLFLLLAVVTFQLSWGVVAAYCTHETGRAAQHLGHHQHDASADELAAGTTPEAPSTAKKANVHAHCASCSHLAALADASMPSVLHLLPAAMPPATATPALSSVFIDPPERPQWGSAV